MSEVQAFPGVFDFFKLCGQKSVSVCIISHKTRYPYLGEPYDLHQSAYAWLEQQGFFDMCEIGLSRDKVYFELTKQTKLNRIAEVNCDYFVDDLPELLSEPTFAANVKPILFDPGNIYAAGYNFQRATSWTDLEALIAWP